MAFQVSPGINVSEVDLTTIVPTVSTTAGAIGGLFRWGPIGAIQQVTSEVDLVRMYGEPTNYNGETFFTAANFLAYGNQLWVSRAGSTTDTTANGCWTAVADSSNSVASYIAGALSTTANTTSSSNTITNISNTANLVVGQTITSPYFANGTTIAAIVNSSAVNASSTATGTSVANGISFGYGVNTLFNIKNPDDYITKYAANNFAGNPTYLFAAKYPGFLGSSLSISLVDTAAAYQSNIVNVANTTFVVSSNTATITFNDTTAIINAATAAANLASYVGWSALTVGDWITVGNSTVGTQALQLTSKGSAPAFANTSGTATPSSNVVTAVANMSGIVVGATVASNVSSITGASVVAVNAIANTVTLSTQFSGGGSQTVTVKAAQESLNLAFSSNYTLYTPVSMSGNIGRLWQYYNLVNGPPTTTPYVAQYGNSAAVDMVHVVVTDALGTFTGTPGLVLEVWQGLSRANDAQTPDGSTNYFQTVLNQNSQYVWWTNNRGSNYTANSALVSSLTGSTYAAPASISFAGGQDGFTEANVGTNIGIITTAYDQFKSTENVNISLLLTGKADDINTTLLPNYLVQNIALQRMDCVVFISPNRSAVVSAVGNELNNCVAFRNGGTLSTGIATSGLVSSTYGVMDSGYKYQYDKYNDVYRYVPLNGDIAGLCVYTDTVRDPWWSPAGFNRGQIKNVIKLAYNPKKADRNVLYPAGINPVATFPGQGTVLYGDKTLSAQPSAFDRINVRRLFIVLEKTIALAAQQSLFEFNDAFTQAQFVSLVTPFLKDVQGRRGIYDFKVVCDGTNNTPQVINNNQFVGDIYVKPARSINYIQLNFTAVRTGVDFSEIVGKF